VKGVILAAGKGSRLYPVTYTIPKPLLPIANRPTLEYAFDRLKEMDVRDVCIVVGENESAMREALGDGSAYGMQLSYVRQTEPKGLAHALGFAQEFLGNDKFVMYLGDAIYGSDFTAFAARFLESGCANMNIVKAVPDPSRFGVANLEGERIVQLEEKPSQPKSNMAMAGMYFFGPEIWAVLPDLKPSGRGEYEITDAIQMLIDRGHTVLAGVYESEWFDTGTLDSFLETSQFLCKGKNQVDLSAKVDGTIGKNVVVGPNARVQCHLLEDAVILPGADVAVDGEIRHSLLGGLVRADSDVVNSILYTTN